jgi:hypothetical protein
MINTEVVRDLRNKSEDSGAQKHEQNGIACVHNQPPMSNGLSDALGLRGMSTVVRDDNGRVGARFEIRRSRQVRIGSRQEPGKFMTRSTVIIQ